MSEDIDAPEILDDAEMDQAHGGLRIDEMTFITQPGKAGIVGRPRHQGLTSMEEGEDQGI